MQTTIIEVEETHLVRYALEPLETVGNAILELQTTEHTRVPLNSVRVRSRVSDSYSIPDTHPMMHEDYLDMSSFNFS